MSRSQDVELSEVVAKRRWLRSFGIAVVVLGVGVAVGISIAQRRSDGPLTAMIPGGELRAGSIVTQLPADWTTVLGLKGSCVDGVCAATKPAELQLVDPPTSRYTGIMVHDGQLYVPCDLGFMWGRFSGSQRAVLHLIYLFKHWHTDALRDGRVVLRIDGMRYEGQAVRVEDPKLVADLRAQVEDMGRSYVAPAPLAPPPAEPPNDIWFFHIVPRST